MSVPDPVSADRLVVADVMLSMDDYATVPAEATMREALLALEAAQPGPESGLHRHRAVLALGPDGSVVGKLSWWAILRALEPRLDPIVLERLCRAGLSGPMLESLEQDLARVQASLAALCRTAGRVRVADAMVPVRESIAADAPLIEAVHTFVAGHQQSLLVTREGSVVGILRLADVFEAVAALIRG